MNPWIGRTLGGCSPQGGPPAGWDTTSAQCRGHILVSTFGRGDVGGGPRGGGDVRPPKH